MTEQEKNKLIERTCKYDAYQMVYMWVRVGEENFIPEHGSAAWYAKEKMDGHKTFLRDHEYRYDYRNGFILNDGYYVP